MIAMISTVLRKAIQDIDAHESIADSAEDLIAVSNLVTDDIVDEYRSLNVTEKMVAEAIALTDKVRDYMVFFMVFQSLYPEEGIRALAQKYKKNTEPS